MTTTGSTRRRIALVTSSFAPHIGGVETHVAHVARGLAQRGHDVEIWTVDRGEGLGVRSWHGVTVRVLPTPLPARNAGAMGRFLARSSSAWGAWVAAYHSFRPAILHVHCFGPNGVYALALHRRYRVPMIVTSHGETFMDDQHVFAQSALLRGALKSSLNHAAAVTAPSQAVLDDLSMRFSLRGGAVVPNGVDLSIHPRRGAFAGSYIFAVGRLGRTKGFDLLLDAFAAARLPNEVGLIIAGDGPERDSLQHRANRGDLVGRVRFLGWLNEQEIADAMGGALAVAVPSRVEAFGIVALEAWRAGAPLIMTRHGGAHEFMTSETNALLTDPNDTDVFASDLERVCRDEELRRQLALGGRERVADFKWERVIDGYEQLLP